ncbi:hypothetical protein [Klenkia terrae]|uniref:Uncharacterized protein n=1 Tax=Klenkia terrae TaxID=1052259 RepID=A0ABU8ECQ3_9ACTN|nr:hypothetical protein [Klenkia terrae]SSC23037.1 Hypothetical protein KLENKIAIHU_1635 [Klenkia terrae]
MALLMRFRRETSTPSTVTYRWGTDQGDLTWTLTIDPADPEAPPKGDGDPRDRATIAAKLTLRWMREGDWPTGGAIQS